MTAVAIVPVQHLSQAKSRLSGRLAPTERRALVIHFLGVVLSSLRGSSSIDQIIVVTPDTDVLGLAACHGTVGMRENGDGLNAAIRQARETAIRWGAGTLLVMLGDLPLVRPDDVDDLLRAADGAGVVIAPDRHRLGTNALVLRPPDALDPAFGPGSFSAHRRAAMAAGLRIQEFQSPAIAFDVDIAADLDELEQLGVNWMDTGGQRTIDPDELRRSGQGSRQVECRGRRGSPVD